MIEVEQLFSSKFLMKYMMTSLKKKTYLAREPKWSRKIVGKMYIEVGVGKITSNLSKKFRLAGMTPPGNLLALKKWALGARCSALEWGSLLWAHGWGSLLWAHGAWVKQSALGGSLLRLDA